MKYDQLKLKMKVVDTWFDYWGTGTVTKIFKTRIHIDFYHEGVIIFDIPHLQFLKEKK